MLTIFTASKPFSGHIDIIQQNAIRSWLSLRPECEIILFGDEQGTAEIAAKLGVRHIPEVKCNEYGTPLISDIFQVAQAHALHPLMCYINADIILMRDFMKAVARVAHRKSRFLLAGRRWDLDVDDFLDFGAHWEQQLKAQLIQNGQLHPPAGTDFFVFPRGLCRNIPPFAVGRPPWDNWLLYRARKLGIPVVDITRVVSVIHQNHDYDHVPDRRGQSWEGPEADYNRALIGSWDYVFTLFDATYILTSKRLFPALGFKYLQRRCEALPVFFPALRPVMRFLSMLRKCSGLGSDR